MVFEPVRPPRAAVAYSVLAVPRAGLAWRPDSLVRITLISDQKFPRTVRLLSAADFGRVFKRPIKSTDNCFVVLARSNSMGEARLGLVIAKKHVKLAVGRNRIKRVIRDSFRHHQQLLKGLDLVVLVRTGTADQPNKRLFSSLEAHWKRLAESKSNSS